MLTVKFTAKSTVVNGVRCTEKDLNRERNGMATLMKHQLAKNSAKFARDMLDYS